MNEENDELSMIRFMPNDRAYKILKLVMAQIVNSFIDD